MSVAEFARDDPPTVAEGAINISGRRWKEINGKIATRRFDTSVRAVVNVKL